MKKEYKTSEREKILSWFAYIIGGFNANAGSQSKLGLYCGDDVFSSDEGVARFLLKTHEESVERPLKEEIKELKAKIYDLQNK